MALSKLHPFSFFSNQTPLPSTKSPPSQLSLLPSKNPFNLHLKTQSCIPSLLLPLPKFPPKEEEYKSPLTYQSNYENYDALSVAFPSFAFSNTLFFNSAYNIQVIVGEHEPEEKLIGRFRREVLRAGVLQESKRRRFFESTQEKAKRKTREAARRNRKRRPQPKVMGPVKADPKKKDDSDDDNWNEFLDIDLPYCR